MANLPEFDPKLPTIDDLIFLIELPPNQFEAFLYGWQIGGLLYGSLFLNEDLVTEEREQDILRLYSQTRPDPAFGQEIDIAQEILQPNIKPRPEQILNPDNSGTATINQKKVPELPETQYPKLEPNTPKANSTNTEATYSVEIAESFKNHTFGCLIGKPYTNKPIQHLVPDLPNVGDFYKQLEQQSREEFKEYLEKLNETDPKTQKNSAAEAIYQILFPYHNNSIYIRGTKALEQIATYEHALAKMIENYPLVGVLSTQPPTFKTYEVPRYNVQAQYHNLAVESTEAGIPLSLYSGHKLDTRKEDQLVIRWEHIDANIRKPKQTTLPHPKPAEEITEDILKNTLPETRIFATNLLTIFYEDSSIDNNSLRVIKAGIFNEFKDNDEARQFVNNELQKWLTNLCSEQVKIQEYTLTLEASDVYQGEYYPKTATLMGWDKERKEFENKHIWKIYEKSPK